MRFAREGALFLLRSSAVLGRVVVVALTDDDHNEAEARRMTNAVYSLATLDEAAAELRVTRAELEAAQ